MTANKAALPWLVGTVLLSVAILGISWALLITPKLDARDLLDEQTASITAENQILEAEVARLKQEHENIEDYRAEIAALRAHIPQVSLIKEHNQLASDQLAAGELGLGAFSYQVSSLAAFAPAPTLPPQPNATDGDGAQTDQDEPSAAGEATNEATPEPHITELLPDTLTVIPFEYSFSGKYEDAIDFINAQQNNERLVLIGSLSFTLVEQDVDDSGLKPGVLPNVFGDVDVFLSGYLWALPPMASEITSEGEDAPLGPWPVPQPGSNPFFPIIGGDISTSSGLPVRPLAKPELEFSVPAVPGRSSAQPSGSAVVD